MSGLDRRSRIGMMMAAAAGMLAQGGHGNVPSMAQKAKGAPLMPMYSGLAMRSAGGGWPIPRWCSCPRRAHKRYKGSKHK